MPIKRVFLAFFIFLFCFSGQSNAQTFGEGVLGWYSQGQYFDTPVQACQNEWNYYITEPGVSRFIGAKPIPNNPVFQQCEWTFYAHGCPEPPLGNGLNGCTVKGPSGVGFYCQTGYESDGNGYCKQKLLEESDPCGPSGGNPILLSSGTKFENKVDFATTDGRLEVRRTYRSTPQRWRSSMDLWAPINAQVGGWSFDFALEWHLDANIGFSGIGYGGTLHASEGRAFGFARDGNLFTSAASGPTSDYKVEIAGTPPANWSTVANAVSQWKVTEIKTGRVWMLQTFRYDPNDSTTIYSIARPVSMTEPDGYVQTFAYGPKGELASITDSYGRTLTFTWRQFIPSLVADPGMLPYPEAISEITLPDGNRLVYTYDPPAASPSNGHVLRLTGVARRNAANTTVESITYHYEDARYPTFLTGITDGRGIRFATFAYDGQGRATLSEHAGGADRSTVAYGTSGNDLTRTVTNAKGKVSVYTFGRPQDLAMTGVYVLKSVVGQSSLNCAPSNSTMTYLDSGFSRFVETVTDEEGRVTKYTRDTLGRPLTMIRGFGTPLATTTSYTWSTAWSTPTQIVQPGLTIDYTRNAAGQLTQVKGTDTTSQTVPYSTAGQIRATDFTWSATGQLLTVNGPLAGAGDTVTYTYDPANGYVKTVTNEVGHVTTVNTVNGRGLPTRITDSNSVITDFVWNEMGWLTSVTVAPGANQAQTSFAYNGAGDMTLITRHGGATLTMTYDNARRLSSVSNSAGESIVYTRDLMGNITKTEVKAGTAVVAERNNVFDELGRLIRTIGANGGQTWAFGYDRTGSATGDANGNLTSVTDPRSKVWQNGFDALNRLVTEAEPGPNTVTLTYNGKDEVASYKDPRNLTTTYVRNGFGDVIRETNPDTGVTDYTYDARGLVTQIKDARLVVANMTYDNAGRMLTRVFPAATTENVTFAYDSVLSGNKGKGRLTQLTDQAGNSKFVYDVRGNLLSETRTIGTLVYTVAYTYDLADRLLTMTYPSGRSVTYVRDAQGRITGVTTKANATAAVVTLASNVAWRPNLAGGAGGADAVFGAGNAGTAVQSQALPGDGGLGNVDLLQSLTYGNGLTLWKNFSLDNEVYQIIVENGPTQIMNRFLNRADLTNITSIIDGLNANDNQSFTYNDQARLSGATANAANYGTLAWTYDANGNRLSETRNGTVNTYTYPATNNRLTTIKQGTKTTRAFLYNARGDVTRDTRGATAHNYAVNNAGRIRTLTIGSTLRATWTYDGFQKLRVKAATSPAATTHYVWDSFGHIIAEHNATGGAALKQYVWLGDTPLAVFDNTTLYYVHPDHLDRPVVMTNASAMTVAWAAKYDPFGIPVAVTVTPTNNQRLPGQWFQSEDGLSYNWHRTYDPTLGRYTQADPLGFVDGPNKYNYVANNPLIKIDPEGLRDGGIFKNKEGLLPAMPHGHYRIIHGPGSTRWVVGACGEIFWSPDHYKSFIGPY